MGLKKLLDSGHKEMKRCEKIAYKIEALEQSISKLTDDQLKDKTEELRQAVKDGKTLDEVLVEAYAVAREAAYRVTGMKAFHVQLIGAIAIHGGNIAEMKTGEGKTLTAVFPAFNYSSRSTPPPFPLKKKEGRVRGRQVGRQTDRQTE